MTKADKAAQSIFESLRLEILATRWSLPWSKVEGCSRLLLGLLDTGGVDAVSADILDISRPLLSGISAGPPEGDGTFKKACCDELED